MVQSASSGNVLEPDIPINITTTEVRSDGFRLQWKLKSGRQDGFNITISPSATIGPGNNCALLSNQYNR